mmetsp:Transcript_56283/g.136442  ORF Transcript_56283/g.136442 Transcript_56283/m.136442 type:complete len:254 (+) Transcript_56283:4532-5293(+)
MSYCLGPSSPNLHVASYIQTDLVRADHLVYKTFQVRRNIVFLEASNHFPVGADSVLGSNIDIPKGRCLGVKSGPCNLIDLSGRPNSNWTGRCFPSLGTHERSGQANPCQCGHYHASFPMRGVTGIRSITSRHVLRTALTPNGRIKSYRNVAEPTRPVSSSSAGPWLGWAESLHRRLSNTGTVPYEACHSRRHRSVPFLVVVSGLEPGRRHHPAWYYFLSLTDRWVTMSSKPSTTMDFRPKTCCGYWHCRCYHP